MHPFRSKLSDRVMDKVVEYVPEKVFVALFVAFAALVPFVWQFVFSFLTAIPTYYLWNWLMPEIFALKAITYWQAYGIQLLCSLLFGTKFVLKW
jgi:hypothetical protein